MTKAGSISAPEDRRAEAAVIGPCDASRGEGGADTDQCHATMRPASNAKARTGSALQIFASTIWIPQAWLLASAVGNIGAGDAAASVWWYATGVFVLGVLRSVLDAAGARIAFRQARHTLSDLRRDALAALADRSPIDPARPASGLAASTLAEQAEAIVPHVARFQPARLRATIMPLLIFACVFVWSWAAALVLLIAAPLIPIFMALIGWRAKAASKAQLVELGSMNAFLLDRLRGLATIRSLGAVDMTARRLRLDAENLRLRTMAVLRIAFLSSAVLELFSALGVAMVAVYVGFHLLGQLPFGAWGTTLSLKEGLFILLLAPAFFEPLRDLSTVWHDRAAGEAAMQAVRDLAQQGTLLPGAQDEDLPFGPAPSSPPGVRIEKLRFRHASNTEPVFDGFDLDVVPGEHVALLGSSGSGKSTLLALLSGFALPESGRILIGGEVMSQRTAAALRRRMAFIGQRPHIFPATLAGNVTLGRPGISRKVVRKALDLVGLGAVAARRGAAPVGEGGVGLSGGEASRLALARIVAAPETGLILADEPTAHLDVVTARQIADALLALADGRTLIVATHDPALAARMDRIVRVTPGRLERAA